MDGYNYNILAGSLNFTFLFIDSNIKFNLFFILTTMVWKSLLFQCVFQPAGVNYIYQLTQTE